MHFRVRFTARGVRLSEAGLEQAEFVVALDHEVRVVVRLPSSEERAQGHKPDNAQCEATMEFEPNERVKSAFEAIAANRLPEESLPRDEWPREFDFIDEELRVIDNYVLPLAILPEPVQSVVEQVSLELSSAARWVVGVVRWRSGDLGLHQPFSSRGAQWSFDGETWRPLPTTTSVEITTVGQIRLDETRRDEIQALLNRQIQEPLAHALFREAWQARRENRRSALMVGMAALEVGVKQYIAEKVPASEWLLEELPAPPINRMLSEYLPAIGLDPLDDDRVRVLKKGINLRNRVAHRGEVNFDYDTLNEILLATRDTLWWLDQHRGFGWAEDFEGQREGSA